jgi:hypothetical protein
MEPHVQNRDRDSQALEDVLDVDDPENRMTAASRREYSTPPCLGFYNTG